MLEMLDILKKLTKQFIIILKNKKVYYPKNGNVL